MWRVLLLLCAVVELQGVARSQELICDPSASNTTGGPPLPQLPPQFSAVIEANLASLNGTITVKEYYDTVKGRSRTDVYGYGSRGTSVTIANFNTGEAYNIIEDTNGEPTYCYAGPISEDVNFDFLPTGGFNTLTNGTVQILSTANFLLFGEQFNETYMGMQIVRGIPCHWWRSCNVSEDKLTQYMIDYYFSFSEWNFVPSMSPVQVVVQGIRPNNIGPPNVTHPVHNIYSFVNFQVRSSPDDLFRLPVGLPCMGRQTGQKPLPALPQDYYSVLYELADERTKTITYIREYYALNQQLVRYDYDGYSNASYAIDDFTAGVQYFINRRYGSCTILPIAEINSTLYLTYGDGSFHQQSIRNHFLRLPQYNYSYEGVSTIRGVDAESWISSRDFESFGTANLTAGYLQIFYSLPDWGVSYGLNQSMTNISIPLRVYLTGDFNYQYMDGNTTVYDTISDLRLLYDMLEYSVEEPVEYDVFDVSVCFGPGQYTTLHFDIPLDVNYTALDHALIRTTMRSTLSSVANVPSSRIALVHLFQLSSTPDTLRGYFHILDPPPHTREMNPTPRDDIVSTLTTLIKNQQLTFNFGGVIVTPTIVPPTTSTCVQPSATFQPSTPSSPPMVHVATSVPRPLSTNVPRPLSTSVPRPLSTSVPRPLSTSVPRPPSTSVPRPPSTSGPYASTVVVSYACSPTPSACLCDSSNMNNLSSSSAIGLAIGMLAAGLVVGVLVTIAVPCGIRLYRTRDGKSDGYEFSRYKKHRDENVIT